MSCYAGETIGLILMLRRGSAVWRRSIAFCAPVIERLNMYVSSTNWVGGWGKRIPDGSRHR